MSGSESFRSADRPTGLDRTFRISVVLTGLDGVLELLGALLLVLVTPDQLDALVRFLTQHELGEDPSDFLASRLVRLVSGLTVSGVLFAAAYLFVHGVVKIGLVGAVLANRLWAYPWMIGFLAVFVIYQCCELGRHFSVGLLLLTAFDVFVIWLTVLEYRKQRQKPLRRDATRADH